MTFTDEIREEADRMWEAILDHPMVRELGQGTLDEAPFRYWVRQDYVYPDRVQPAIRTRRLEGVHARPHGERSPTSSNRPSPSRWTSIARTLKSSASAKPSWKPRLRRRRRAYTDFLVRTAALGTFGDTVAALLPCMWGFNETGTRLAASGESDDERYATWIDMYSGEEFTELTDWCKGLMNDVATNATESDRERYRELFVTSARYEYRFWDAAWRQEAGEV